MMLVCVPMPRSDDDGGDDAMIFLWREREKG